MRDNRHRLTSELTLLGLKGSGGQGGPQADAPRVGGSIDRDKVFILDGGPARPAAMLAGMPAGRDAGRGPLRATRSRPELATCRS